MKITADRLPLKDVVMGKIKMVVLVVQAVFIWIVVGSVIRRRYRRCIERDEIFYLDEELGGR